MSEVVERVWWINAPERPGRIDRIRDKLAEVAGRGPRHVSREGIPFSTSISVAEIEDLDDEGLREALLRQLGDKANGSHMLTIPVAGVESRKLSHVVHVSRHPIGPAGLA